MAGPEIDLPHGTQVTLRIDTGKHAKGAAGIIADSGGLPGCYLVCFPDGSEELLHRNNLTILRLHQKEVFAPDSSRLERYWNHVVYIAQTGSKAYGLDTESSDDDLRGFFVAPLSEIAGLRKPNDTITLTQTGTGTDIGFWEVGHFMRLCLNANPNALETIFSPLEILRCELAEPILENRDVFLSRQLYATYQGYSLSQLKKAERDLRNNEEVRPKHVMHLIRLLISGIHALRTGEILVDVTPYREQLLAIKTGEMLWAKVNVWRLQLHAELELAHQETKLPEYPDYDRANDLLLDVRWQSTDHWN